MTNSTRKKDCIQHAIFMLDHLETHNTDMIKYYLKFMADIPRVGKRKADVLYDRLVLNYTYKKIAEKLGVTSTRARQIAFVAVDRIREATQGIIDNDDATMARENRVSKSVQELEEDWDKRYDWMKSVLNIKS